LGPVLLHQRQQAPLADARRADHGAQVAHEVVRPPSWIRASMCCTPTLTIRRPWSPRPLPQLCWRVESDSI
ncbi:MAG TPA: hypothetical protein VLL05_01455, partial [Terriglobales bacterium]|nr:hypothetical protein [Terriglobales bacterium]